MFSFTDNQELWAFSRRLERWAGPGIFVGLTPAKLFERPEPADALARISGASLQTADGQRVSADTDAGRHAVRSVVSEYMREFQYDGRPDEALRAQHITARNGDDLGWITGTIIPGHEFDRTISDIDVAKYTLAYALGHIIGKRNLLGGEQKLKEAAWMTFSLIYNLLHTNNAEQGLQTAKQIAATYAIGAQSCPPSHHEGLGNASVIMLHLLRDNFFDTVPGLVQSSEKLISAAYLIATRAKDTMQEPEVGDDGRRAPALHVKEDLYDKLKADLALMGEDETLTPAAPGIPGLAQRPKPLPGGPGSQE
ncbi:MAG: hypothetical protein AB7G06_01285 [Bdellovibrionales bacterium]